MYGFNINRTAYTMRILYLFTVDDFISIILTTILCGATLSLTEGFLRKPAVLGDVLPRAPLILLWVWSNLLLFNMSNQSQPGALLEDATNKPWRPIASGRICIQDVALYIRVTRLGLLGLSLSVGGFYASLCLQLLTFCYNDLNGGEHWLFRNFLNAGGYLCFIIGAVQVTMATQKFDCSGRGLVWLCCTSAIIISTMHIQDLYDQKGDRMRNRKTIPLIFGDLRARYSILLMVLFWSFTAPAYWTLSIISFLPTVVLGTLVAVRLSQNETRDVAHDKMTFVYWSIWLISIQILPLWSTS